MEKNEETKGIDKRVTYCESFIPIIKAELEDSSEIEGIFGMMSEADRVRLSYQIFYKIKFS